MSDENLKEVFQQAAEIARSVPKELREAAFNRALDALLEPAKSRPATTRRRSGRLRNTNVEGDASDPVTVLLADLDRTGHPEVAAAPRVLERALFLLRAARDDHQIDGLGTPQIAKVLTEKFRLRTTRQAVTHALDAAGDKVDRTSASGSVSYRLMQPGDEYLNAGDFASAKASNKSSKKKTTTKRSRKRSTRKKAAAAKKASGKAKAGKKAPKAGRPGAGVMLKGLANSGFFAKHRSIADIQHHCEKKLAHKYALNELSTPLRRAVHSGLLKRDQNDSDQYEYIAQ